jgi:two-component system sensor histidine kinase KdpD
MTRLEAGTVKVIKQPCDVQDVIGSALEQLKEPLRNYPVCVDVPDEIPPVPMDFVLIVQVLVNLIDNAIKYSNEGSPIDIDARITGAFLEIQVADRGFGIPMEDLSRVFDKFYRVQRPQSVSGTGLGLSICKGIAEAHGGFIGAENREGGGTIITLALPME